MPTGSLCAERNVIGTALAADMTLRRQDLKLIAVFAAGSIDDVPRNVSSKFQIKPHSPESSTPNRANTHLESSGQYLNEKLLRVQQVQGDSTPGPHSEASSPLKIKIPEDVLAGTPSLPTNQSPTQKRKNVKLYRSISSASNSSVSHTAPSSPGAALLAPLTAGSVFGATTPYTSPEEKARLHRSLVALTEEDPVELALPAVSMLSCEPQLASIAPCQSDEAPLSSGRLKRPHSAPSITPHGAPSSRKVRLVGTGRALTQTPTGLTAHAHRDSFSSNLGDYTDAADDYTRDEDAAATPMITDVSMNPHTLMHSNVEALMQTQTMNDLVHSQASVPGGWHESCGTCFVPWEEAIEVDIK
jgi:hypothetical protein